MAAVGCCFPKNQQRAQCDYVAYCHGPTAGAVSKSQQQLYALNIQQVHVYEQMPMYVCISTCVVANNGVCKHH